MSGIAGVRRTRNSPVVLASCTPALLAAGTCVVVADLQAPDGAPGPSYLADVVFGPQDVVSSTGCVPAARILRVATADDLAQERRRESRHTPGTTGVDRGVPTATTQSPLWIGVAPRAEDGRQRDLPGGASVNTPLQPTTHDEIAAEAADLLAIVEEGRHGVRGFGDDLPALGQEIALSGGGTAVVTGIDGKRGRLHARLPGGEVVIGPLPARADAPWSPTTTGGDGEDPRSKPSTGQDIHE
jgi:hypothetical protein